MQASTWYASLKMVSFLVIALGGISIGYAIFIGIKYWSGIGV